MPVILEPQDWSAMVWTRSEGDPATLLRPAAEDVLKVWPVGGQVNCPTTNGTELLETVG